MLLTYIFIYDRISHINRKDNMEDNKHFTITYYAKKHKKHISRQAKWDSLCRYWTSKQGNALITYFDIDANNYRTCSGNYKIRF